uniref:Gustatory receptor n=1 Tax=Strigamia maritima TaxID=126957 RepID=T1JLE7_STRMM
MMALMHVMPKNIEENSQLRDEYTRKFNRLWSRLFWLYGLQLHYDDEGNSFSKWKKFVIVLLPRLLTVLFTLRRIILIIRWSQYEILVMYFPSTIFNTVSIVNAVFLLRRKAKFSALHKILLDLSIKSSEIIKRRMQRQIYIVLFILAIFNVLLFIDVMVYIRIIHKYIAYNLLIYTEFNSHLLRIFVFLEYIFYFIYTQIFFDITVLYFSYMCKLLSLAFKNLNEEIERSFVLTSALTNAKLNKFRRRYQYLSRLAEQISENFSPLVLFWLVGLIVIFCMRIRSLKNVPEVISALYYVVEVSRISILVIVIFNNSSELLSQIRKMKGKISELMIFGDDTEEPQESILVNCLLFSQTFNADTVGINVSGLFLLSTVSFLNMASTVMTYVVLVYQS